MSQELCAELSPQGAEDMYEKLFYNMTYTHYPRTPQNECVIHK